MLMTANMMLVSKIKVPKYRKKPHKPHWYFQYLGECPVCGRDQSIRERRYTPKPKDPSDRIEYLSATVTYDNCMG